ncbi:MAG: hypothetical protein AB1465_04170 [Patescibacteria group bacterium]
MTLSVFLYIFWAFLAVFIIFNLLLLRHFLKFKYLGKAVFPLILVYFIGFLVIIAVAHFFILKADWDVALF